MDQERLLDQLRNSHTGIQASRRVLENHLHILTDGTHLILGDMGDLFSLEPDLAGIRDQKMVDQTSGGGLTTAGLAYDGEGLTFVNVKTYVITA